MARQTQLERPYWGVTGIGLAFERTQRRSLELGIGGCGQ